MSVEKYIDLISLRRKKMQQYIWEAIGKQLSTKCFWAQLR